MKQVAQLEGKNEETLLPRDYFDMMAGTSTGGYVFLEFPFVHRADSSS